MRNDIFIVDDDSEDVELLARGFRGAAADCDILHLSNGLELFAELEARADRLGGMMPDLILLDLQMPVMGGEVTLKRLKMDDRFKSIPVVVLSSSKNQNDVDSIYQLGANSFVTKPDSLEGYGKASQLIDAYWLRFAQLPGRIA